MFNFVSFFKVLLGRRKLIESVYYVGKVRTDGTEKTQRLFNNQRKLFSHLKKYKIRYSLGYLMKTKGRFHEKGVDVNIAVDILVSSDTDLLPAIKKAKEKSKTVEYVGFYHQPSIALVANCSKSWLLTKEDLLPFIKKRSEER